METTAKENAPTLTEFSLRQILSILWNGRWLVIVLTVLSTTAAGIAAWYIPKTYEAAIVISPAAENSGSQMGTSGSLGQFAGLASLAGLSSGGDSKKAESMTVLQSEALTEKYIADNQLLPILFASKWDSTKMDWRESDKEKQPTLWKGNRMFRQKIRNVVTNPKTGIATMTISWRDPKLAAEWANGLISLANAYLRDKALIQSDKNVSYLTSEAAKTDVVGVKLAIYSILQAEISKAMLARGNDEYAFKVLDRAAVPEQQAAPRKVLWLAGGFALGVLLSVVVLLGRVTRIV